MTFTLFIITGRQRRSAEGWGRRGIVVIAALVHIQVPF